MELFLGQAPLYLGIWLISFVVILFVSRFLLKKAFTPSEEMIKSQKDFVAAASHELKAPLAVIMANAEALQDVYKRQVPPYAPNGRILVCDYITCSKSDRGECITLVGISSV